MFPCEKKGRLIIDQKALCIYTDFILFFCVVDFFGKIRIGCVWVHLASESILNRPEQAV